MQRLKQLPAMKMPFPLDGNGAMSVYACFRIYVLNPGDLTQALIEPRNGVGAGSEVGLIEEELVSAGGPMLDLFRRQGVKQEVQSVEPLSDAGEDHIRRFMGEVVERVRGLIDKGARVYWVCPLVEESENFDATAAEERFKLLRAAVGDGVVGLVHGQLAPDQKTAAMADFAAGKTRVLVATTVIEVGVDVPNASIMVIEQAEIFGLAQVHQLRRLHLGHFPRQMEQVLRLLMCRRHQEQVQACRW
jgi:hypothetical protein